jgi:signal transduction histidine kinase
MAMQATIEAIIDGVLPAGPEHLGTIHSEVVRLGRLVDAQLRLSRLENKSLALKEEEINLGDLIANLVVAHEMFVEESDLTIEFSADPGVMVIGDPDMLRQATANLLSNSVRYTPAGGSIAIKVRRGQMMAQIIVADTGIGISSDDIRNVFIKFWRSDAGRNRESGGLGIGLAMVKEIADRHKGWVNVESVMGKGTTFTIHIPLHSEVQRRRNKSK